MQCVKKAVQWPRLLCVVVTASALYYIFHRLSYDQLVRTLRTIHTGWFLVAWALYGFVFLPATWRWHLILQLMGNAVHPAITLRFSFIGHFFYTIFFGVVGGDTTKAALYARWYGWPLPQILATAPLDRLLGFAGLLLFMICAFAIATVSDGFARLGSFYFTWSWAWALALLLVIGIGLWLGSRARTKSFVASFERAFSNGVRQLFKAPCVALAGVLCGFLVQAALSGVIALNLQAVSTNPLPWSQLIWTFPVITIISALPITMAGLGAREGATLALLGLYGVSPENAIAASLLTVVVSLSWALVGALLCLYEERLRGPGTGLLGVCKT